MTALTDPKIIAVRKKLRDDFLFYAEKCAKIRPKKVGDLVPFKINRAQSVLHEIVEEQLRTRGKVRVIILKARQQGLSTYVGARLYHAISHTRAAKALVLAHDATSTKTLFEMVHRYHANVPEIVRPSTRFSSKRELTFDILDSSYFVATAGGQAIARGETLNYLHASEAAFWPSSSARDIWNGIEQAVADTKGSHVYIESTANGMSNFFYDMWKASERGETGYACCFIPWFIEDVYNLLDDDEVLSEVPVDFRRTTEEEFIAARALKDWDVIVTDTQLHWRRQKIARNGIDRWKQEYPATPDEAFIASGRPVFNPEQIHELLQAASDPNRCMRLALEGAEWKMHSRGELVVYHPPEPGQLYVVGADVAGGVKGGDWSVAQVLDKQKRQVATFRAQILPDYFAEICVRLADYYNHARLAVEANNHGQLTCYRLKEDFSYDNLYYTTVYDKVTDQETKTPGFTTNVKTRPLILDQLRADVRDGAIKLSDKITLEEMLTFVVNEAGKPEAEEGCHDDCVMSLAIANFAHEGIPQPIDMDDDFYVDADIY